jgi:hypothetical protein
LLLESGVEAAGPGHRERKNAMRTTRIQYYGDLLVRQGTVALTIDEARSDLDRTFWAARLGNLN